jgi:peroxiredoxin
MALTQAPDAALGTPAPDFSLPGIDGAVHSRSSCRGPAGLLVMFICNHCPYVQSLRDRLVDDMRELHALGIGVVAINPNDPTLQPHDDLAHMQQQAREWGFCFPYLQDLQQQVARDYGAVCTPDFFGYDRDLKLAYRGRLDDGRPASQRTELRRELVLAMTEVAERGRCSQPQEPSLGCSIKWRR